MAYVIDPDQDTCVISHCKDENDQTVRIEYFKTTTTHKASHGPPFTRQQMNDDFRSMVKRNKIPWIKPGYHETIFDLGEMKAGFQELESLDWLRGKISVKPEFELKDPEAEMKAMKKYFQSMNPDRIYKSSPFLHWHATLFFTLLPELVDRQTYLSDTPVEIHNSLQKFKMDYPEPNKVAFLIMRFKETRVHLEIEEAIRDGLKRHGIDALRADVKHYHDDLYHNILTYMHGCGFGVAVFERIEEEVFNPNISLEVGYMLALQKPICILKDRTLKTLYTDLMGKLYKAFDPMRASETLDAALTDWLRDKALI